MRGSRDLIAVVLLLLAFIVGGNFAGRARNGDAPFAGTGKRG